MAQQSVTAQASGLASARRFEALDSWRGLAAIFIVLFHAQVASHFRDAALVRAGEMFVDFFFVLSGFVIAHAYSDRLSNAAEFGRFMILRVGRVLPLHLVMLSLFVAMEAAKALVPGLGAPGDQAFTGTNDFSAILTNMFLVQVGTHDQLTWNTPAWSIAAEMAAYVAFGVATLFAGRFLWVVAAASAAVSGVILFAVAPHGMESTYDWGIVRAIYGLSVGILAYRLSTSAAGGALVAQRGFSATAIEVATVALVLVYTAYAYGTGAAYAAPLVYAAVVLVFAAERGGISSLLRQRAFLAIGAVSFSIYMVHMFLEMRVVNVARLADKVVGTHTVVPMGHGGEGIDLGDLFAGDLLIAALIAVTLAASFVTYRFVEQPGRAWFRLQADWLFAPRARRTAVPVLVAAE